jgi:hypothetical protein
MADGTLYAATGYSDGQAGATSSSSAGGGRVEGAAPPRDALMHSRPTESGQEEGEIWCSKLPQSIPHVNASLTSIIAHFHLLAMTRGGKQMTPK